MIIGKYIPATDDAVEIVEKEFSSTKTTKGSSEKLKLSAVSI
jgi:hypothetical protein